MILSELEVHGRGGVTSHVTTNFSATHVIFKPLPGLGRLRVVGLASQGGLGCFGFCVGIEM